MGLRAYAMQQGTKISLQSPSHGRSQLHAGLFLLGAMKTGRHTEMVERRQMGPGVGPKMENGHHSR